MNFEKFDKWSCLAEWGIKWGVFFFFVYSIGGLITQELVSGIIKMLPNWCSIIK